MLFSTDVFEALYQDQLSCRIFFR